MGGKTNRHTYDTTSEDSTTRTSLASIVFAKQEQFTLSSLKSYMVAEPVLRKPADSRKRYGILADVRQ